MKTIKEMKSDLLTERDRMMVEYLNEAPSYEYLKRQWAKGKVSRRYKDIVDNAQVGIPVVWGKGGQQTKRINEYKEQGVKYIHIVDFN